MRMIGIHNKECFDKYYAYMQEVTPRLVEAEKVIHEIKSSSEWKRAFNYFHVLYQRGYLKDNPCSRNGS